MKVLEVLKEGITELELAAEVENTIIPNFGGIKIEENVIVKEKGCENLSHIERKLFEIDKI